MVRVGETSKRYFRDNLYNLLARRAIQIMQQYRWQAAAKANQTNSLPVDMTDMDQFVTYQFVPVSDCDLTAAVMQTYQSLLKAYDTETEREGWLLTGRAWKYAVFMCFSCVLDIREQPSFFGKLVLVRRHRTLKNE